jgi:uncharacterized protein (DUF433 family)
MPDHVHDKPSETEATTIEETPAESCAVNGKAGEPRKVARLVDRDGVVYVEGCDVPVWRLEMGRRAGSRPAAQMGAFPTLTPEGLELAYAYAQEHSAEFDPLIQHNNGSSVPPEDEGDDEDDATFDAELEALLVEHAEVFRRLAQ